MDETGQLDNTLLMPEIIAELSALIFFNKIGLDYTNLLSVQGDGGTEIFIMHRRTEKWNPEGLLRKISTQSINEAYYSTLDYLGRDFIYRDSRLEMEIRKEILAI